MTAEKQKKGLESSQGKRGRMSQNFRQNAYLWRGRTITKHKPTPFQTPDEPDIQTK